MGFLAEFLGQFEVTCEVYVRVGHLIYPGGQEGQLIVASVDKLAKKNMRKNIFKMRTIPVVHERACLQL